MDREQAKATLKACEPELKALGVVSASIFGSIARGERDLTQTSMSSFAWLIFSAAASM
jgi:predicted nucleotidyltransferase